MNKFLIFRKIHYQNKIVNIITTLKNGLKENSFGSKEKPLGRKEKPFHKAPKI